MILPDDFYIGAQSSKAFGARLLSTYSVGGASLERSRVMPAAGMQFIPIASRYGLRSITLPVHIFGDSPRAAGEAKSKLDAALLQDPVEIFLPDGFWYTASLDSIGDVTEVTADGCILAGTYELSGFRHDALKTVQLPAGGGTLYADGTAPDMECRLSVTVGATADYYLMAGILWVSVSAGDRLVLDGINHTVLRNGVSELGRCDLTRWPLLAAGNNVLTAPDPMQVEYYPIWI